MTRCFFEGWESAGPCDGRLIRAHLIKQQVLRREFPKDWRWLANDPRSWVLCCGGITGCSGHHGALDVSRKLRIPRDKLPTGFIEFCDENGLGWYIDREYPASGPRGERGRDAAGPGDDAGAASAGRESADDAECNRWSGGRNAPRLALEDEPR